MARAQGQCLEQASLKQLDKAKKRPDEAPYDSADPLNRTQVRA